MLSSDQKDALMKSYMKMLDQFPQSAEDDDIQEDSSVEYEGSEEEDDMEEMEDEEKKMDGKKMKHKGGGALVIAFGKMRGK